MTFGNQNSEAEAHSQLDYALERDINFIDVYDISLKRKVVKDAEKSDEKLVDTIMAYYIDKS